MTTSSSAAPRIHSVGDSGLTGGARRAPSLAWLGIWNVRIQEIVSREGFRVDGADWMIEARKSVLRVGSRVEGRGSRSSRFGYGAKDLKFSIWYLVFGVWRLAFGVWSGRAWGAMRGGCCKRKRVLITSTASRVYIALSSSSPRATSKVILLPLCPSPLALPTSPAPPPDPPPNTLPSSLPLHNRSHTLNNSLPALPSPSPPPHRPPSKCPRCPSLCYPPPSPAPRRSSRRCPLPLPTPPNRP